MKDIQRQGPPLYTIGMVKEATGLTERRIRYYESQHLIQPRRTAGNQRLYSEHDIALLLEIKAMLEQGMSLKGIREKLGRSPVGEREPLRDDPVERDAEAYFEARHIVQGEHRQGVPTTLAASISRLRRRYEWEEALTARASEGRIMRPRRRRLGSGRARAGPSGAGRAQTGTRQAAGEDKAPPDGDRV